MRKTLYLGILLTAAIPHAQGQYLYGTSAAAGATPGIVRWDLTTNTLAAVVADGGVYQPNVARDTGGRVFYLRVPNLSPTSTAPDSIVTVSLWNNARARKAVPKGSLPLPQFYNGKLVSVSPGGMAAYDFASGQYTITDTAFKVSDGRQSDFDYSNQRYLLYKRGQGNMNDTLFVYNMVTKARSVFPVNLVGGEMAYSPASNKVFLLGAPPSGTSPAYGVYSIHAATGALTMETSVVSAPLLTGSSTVDPIGNRYFAVRVITGPGGTTQQLFEYRINTNMVVTYPLSSPGIGFLQFFRSTAAPTSIAGAGAGYDDEPMQLSPNPTASQLRVQLTADAARRATTIEVRDLRGSTVRTVAVTGAGVVISMEDLPAGTYAVTLAVGQKQYSKMVQKR